MQKRHIALFVLTACLGATLGRATPPVNPYGMSGGKMVPATNVDTSLLSGPLTCSVSTSALPTGASTSALQTSGNASLASLDTKTPSLITGRVPVDPSGVTSPVSIAATVAVSGPLTDAQLRASAVPVSLASAPLGTGAATAARQDTGNTSAASIDTKTPALGQATMASSSPVVIASNQSSIPITGTFWQSTQPVSAASLPLPTGAAADSSVNGLLLAQGSTTSGQSGPLCQASVTTSAPTYTTAKTNPLSMTTAGGLRVDSSSWIGSTAPTVGAKASTSSIPVVVATDQVAFPVNAYGGAAVGGSPSGNPVVAGVVDGSGLVRSAASDSGGRLKRAGYSYYHITGALTGANVKSGASVLHSITFGYGVALTTITIYDNTTNAAPVVSGITNPAGAGPSTLVMDWALGTGLTVTTTGATEDITLAYE